MFSVSNLLKGFVLLCGAVAGSAILFGLWMMAYNITHPVPAPTDSQAIEFGVENFAVIDMDKDDVITAREVFNFPLLHDDMFWKGRVETSLRHKLMDLIPVIGTPLSTETYNTGPDAVYYHTHGPVGQLMGGSTRKRTVYGIKLDELKTKLSLSPSN